MDEELQQPNQIQYQSQNQTDKQQKVHSFWQHFSKKTLVLILVLLVVTGGLLYFAIREDQPVHTSSPVPTPKVSNAHTVLGLTQLASASARQSIAVTIDSNSNTISGIQLNLSYDPKVLTNVSIQPGTFLKNPMVLLSNVDQSNGRLSFVLALPPTQQQASGSGAIATISYTLLSSQAATTTIHFLPKTQVTQDGIIESVLQKTTDLTMQLPHALQTRPLSATPSAK